MIYKSYLLEQNFKGADKNLFLFYGENEGLKNEFRHLIKQINLKSEVIAFSQEEVLNNEDKFFNELNNISLFEKEKIFIIDLATDKILSVIKEIEVKSINQKIYLFSEILEKKSKLRNFFEKSDTCGICACYADNALSIKKIILKKLSGFKGLSNQNINLILDNCNLDRLKLNNELDKITTCFPNKEIIYEKLEELLNAKINEDFNMLKNEAFKGDKQITNKLLSDTIIDPDRVIYYVSLINQQLKRLNEICELSKDNSLEESINKIKPPIFWKEKPIFNQRAKVWNKDKISSLLNQTYDIEIKIKSNSNMNRDVLVKNLIVNICNLANA